jgi:hypothetical protein
MLYPNIMMHLTLTDEGVLQLLEQLTAHTGESAESALRVALEQRLATLPTHEPPRYPHDGVSDVSDGEVDVNERAAAILAWLEKNVWSQLPEDVRGHAPSKAEQDKILF